MKGEHIGYICRRVGSAKVLDSGGGKRCFVWRTSVSFLPYRYKGLRLTIGGSRFFLGSYRTNLKYTRLIY